MPMLTDVVLALSAACGWSAELMVRRTRGPVGTWRPALLMLLATALTLGVATRGHGRPHAEDLVLVLVAVPLSVVDLTERRLPDRITVPTAASIFLLLTIGAIDTGQAAPLLKSALWAAVTGLSALALAMTAGDSIGLGDVKLLALTTLCTGRAGARATFDGLLLAFLCAALTAAVLIRFGRMQRSGRLPFGPFIVAGALAAIMLG